MPTKKTMLSNLISTRTDTSASRTITHMSQKITDIDSNISDINTQLQYIIRGINEGTTTQETTTQDNNPFSNLKVLLLTHGEIGNGFWDEVDMGFINLANNYKFSLDIQRFGQTGVESQISYLENIIYSENSDGDKVMDYTKIIDFTRNYDVLFSTVLDPRIAELLNIIARNVDTVTYNTSVASVPNAIGYTGAGNIGEYGQGFDVAIQEGLDILSNQFNNNEFNFDDVKNRDDIKNNFINTISSSLSDIGIPVLEYALSENVENSAFNYRFNGIKEIFSNTSYIKGVDNLKQEIQSFITDNPDKNNIIILLFCLQESVLNPIKNALQELSNDNSNINLIPSFSIVDLTKETIDLIKDNTSSVTALSGYSPVQQAVVAFSMGVTLLDVFGRRKLLLQRYMFTGNNNNTISGSSSGNTDSLPPLMGSTSGSGSTSTSWPDLVDSIGSGDDFVDPPPNGGDGNYT